MKKAGDAGKAACEAIKIVDRMLTESLKTMSEVAEAENALAAVSSYDLVHALRPVAQELSEWTGKRYVDYLDQAREMILDGKDQADVLWHFDSILRDLA
jgi:glycerate-2-kinase